MIAIEKLALWCQYYEQVRPHGPLRARAPTLLRAAILIGWTQASVFGVALTRTDSQDRDGEEGENPSSGSVHTRN